MKVGITECFALSGLGNTLEEQIFQIENHAPSLFPLKNLYSQENKENSWGNVLGSWIRYPESLKNRKYTPLSEFSCLLAKQLFEKRKFSLEEKRKMGILVGSSRGNIGFETPHPLYAQKRPLKLMSASNSTHQEMMIAISVEYGIQGHTQTLATGCSSSLDALGWAYLLIQLGKAEKILVLGAEMPLSPQILQYYSESGMLNKNNCNDPYAEDTSGFFPAEGIALLLLEKTENPSVPFISGYWSNSDGKNPLASDFEGISKCLEQAKKEIEEKNLPPIRAIVPHCSGTQSNRNAELSAFQKTFSLKENPPSLHLLKPFIGHTLGASGALETALLTSYLSSQKLPPNLCSLSSIELPLPKESSKISSPLTALKIASSMGGHNSILGISTQ